MNSVFKITKKQLYKLFIKENKTRKEVAEEYGCSEVLIKKKCQLFNIKKSHKLQSLNKERKVKTICLYCKKEHIVLRSRKKHSKYCSQYCSQKSKYLGEEHKRKISNEIAARRRAKKKNQTPDLTQEEKNKIKEIYLKCPEGYEVDHIIPISKGGLHHPNNLQILSITENRKKHNKLV